jgi:hypothetical protein
MAILNLHFSILLISCLKPTFRAGRSIQNVLHISFWCCGAFVDVRSEVKLGSHNTAPRGCWECSILTSSILFHPFLSLFICSVTLASSIDDLSFHTLLSRAAQWSIGRVSGCVAPRLPPGYAFVRELAPKDEVDCLREGPCCSISGPGPHRHSLPPWLLFAAR